MTTTSQPTTRSGADGRHDHGPIGVRRFTETKAFFKTTEFMAYVAMLAGVFIAGAVISASGYGGHHDPFRADKVWLYAVILTVGYIISRGLAKSGTREPYTEER